jgi:hypothetical protein
MFGWALPNSAGGAVGRDRLEQFHTIQNGNQPHNRSRIF